MLYRRDEETCLVLTCEDDDELFYLLGKLQRTRVKWLKKFAGDLLADFYEKINGGESCPPAIEINTNNKRKLN